MKILLLVCLATLLFSSLAAGEHFAGAQRSSTEDRQRLVSIAHKLKAAPLDKGLHGDREWAIHWVIQVPDVSVKLCTNLLGDFIQSKYKYAPEIVAQLTLSSAAFEIEHPEQAKDDVAQFNAGVEGVLKAYSAILKEKPNAKSPALDNLLQKQSQGQLADALREASRSCK